MDAAWLVVSPNSRFQVPGVAQEIPPVYSGVVHSILFLLFTGDVLRYGTGSLLSCPPCSGPGAMKSCGQGAQPGDNGAWKTYELSSDLIETAVVVGVPFWKTCCRLLRRNGPSVVVSEGVRCSYHSPSLSGKQIPGHAGTL